MLIINLKHQSESRNRHLKKWIVQIRITVIIWVKYFQNHTWFFGINCLLDSSTIGIQLASGFGFRFSTMRAMRWQMNDGMVSSFAFIIATVLTSLLLSSLAHYQLRFLHIMHSIKSNKYQKIYIIYCFFAISLETRLHRNF